jgi:HSP20 family molecular chaperone IbpA
VPFDLGSFRKLKERAEGSRHTTFVVDVVFNPLVVQLFMDDEFCSAMEQRESPYRPWLLNLVLNRIEESIGVKLSSQKVKLVKQYRYKDGEDGGPTPKEFMELPGDRDSMGAEDDSMPRAPPKNEEANNEPLIQDCTPGQRRTKPALKKGFLNNKEAAGSLYGAEGSKEGVVPENAGDPMGWMPKKLRNTAKIIDCNSPEYQAQEKAKKSADEQNAVNQEFRDSLMGSFDAMQKKQRHNHWETDLPDGTDDVIPIKYNNDYARFNKMDFGDDEQDNKQPERDWYVDTKGNMHHRQPGATGSRPSGYPDEDKPEGPAAPAVKKGFLDGAKKPLYGPEGSTQGRSTPDVSEEQMMRDLKNMMGEQGAFNSEDLEEAQKMADMVNKASAGAKPPSVAVKAKELPTPDFTLTEADGALQLVISVPGLASMQGVDLDVTERSASLCFPSEVSLRPLKVQLPEAVQPTKVKAKFSRKTHQITVTMPR